MLQGNTIGRKRMEEIAIEIRGDRKSYEAPAVLYEAPLEVRAGSPFVMPEGLDELMGQ